jgi:hypothetical protein
MKTDGTPILPDPTSAHAFNNRGLVWEKKGDAEKTGKDFAEAKRLGEL